MSFDHYDYIGLAGGLLILFGFWRINSGYWKVSSAWYELDNILGSVLMLTYTWNKHVYISSLLNIIWLYVALRGLSSFAERRMMHDKNFRRGYRRGRSVTQRKKKHRTT